MAFYDIPVLYQMEAVLQKHRISKTYNVFDYQTVEIQDINSDSLQNSFSVRGQDYNQTKDGSWLKKVEGEHFSVYRYSYHGGQHNHSLVHLNQIPTCKDNRLENENVRYEHIDDLNIKTVISDNKEAVTREVNNFLSNVVLVDGELFIKEKPGVFSLHLSGLNFSDITLKYLRGYEDLNKTNNGVMIEIEPVNMGLIFQIVEAISNHAMYLSLSGDCDIYKLKMNEDIDYDFTNMIDFKKILKSHDSINIFELSQELVDLAQVYVESYRKLEENLCYDTIINCNQCLLNLKKAKKNDFSIDYDGIYFNIINELATLIYNPQPIKDIVLNTKKWSDRFNQAQMKELLKECQINEPAMTERKNIDTTLTRP